MSYWEHLFIKGEFAPRERMLAGLTLQQVTRRVSEGSHSIYEELFHSVRCQAWPGFGSMEPGDLYPADEPVREEQWTKLVKEFLDGLERAVALASSAEKLEQEVQPGETFGELLHSIAMHNAYHMGKIVAIRQAIGAWPPDDIA